MEQEELEELYQAACKKKALDKTEKAHRATVKKFKELTGYKDSDELAADSGKKARNIKRRRLYKEARLSFVFEDSYYDIIPVIEKAIANLETMPNYLDSAEMLQRCTQRLTKLKALHEADAETLRQQEISPEKGTPSKSSKGILVGVLLGSIVIIGVILFATGIL